MSLSKTYTPQEAEKKWYAYWLENNFFSSTPDPSKKPYTVVIPPPNVTGVLHMGHMLNNTIQDILVRKARMQGFESCWVPGTDHASIATEARVVAMLKEKGIDKKDISREEFLKHAWEWKEKYGGIILEQLKKLGASCDWSRTRFTMERVLSEAVIEVFCKLYDKGLIYRGARMIHWDPVGKTALSDEEVIYKESAGKLHFIKYYAAEENGLGEKAHLPYFTIATTRPETIMGDVAICVHPEDNRYQHLIGKKFFVPLINKAIPVITDESVDKDFGTGSLKVTPAHDLVDYTIGLKYNLEIIDVLNPDGTLSAAAQLYVGEDRFTARKKILKELEEKGHLIESKEIVNNVGTSERTGAVVEPRISTQWFVKMKDLAKPALESVLSDTIHFHPKEKFINTYTHWMENVKDWCISRQLWWGQQIPAWYDEKGNFVVATTKEEAYQKYQAQFHTKATLTQDEDCLDTWFSSWLWPISVFDGFKNPDGADINYYYPTSDLVTAPDILFFWVARMIMAGYEFKGQPPFKNVYLTGIVRDKLGRKMSKSLGNSPDPLELIANYGADGVRVGMLLSSSAGNDLLFDEKLCEQGRNFSNKLWNAYRLTQTWQTIPGDSAALNTIAIEWFTAVLNKAIYEIHHHFEKFRISDALKALYKLIWDDYCAVYLEIVKPAYQQPIEEYMYQQTVDFLQVLLQLAHPFMPFITEEIWQDIQPRSVDQALVVSSYPTSQSFDPIVIQEFDHIYSLVSGIRNFRNSKQLPPKKPLPIFIKTTSSKIYTRFKGVITALAHVSELQFVSEKPANSYGFVVKADEVFIGITESVNTEKEVENLQKELEYTRGFLTSVEKKLSNEKFVQNAKPEILLNEQNKKADAEAKIKALEESLRSIL